MLQNRAGRVVLSAGRVVLGVALASGFLAVGGQALAQSKDPLIGIWRIDRAKSEFMPDNTLQDRVITIEVKGAGISAVQKTVVEAGNTVTSEYAGAYDGKDAPISGSLLDTVGLKRVNANTVERTGKIRGKAVETATMTVSADGKVLTITTKGSVDGNDYSSTQVFNKE
jgi:hypothetical protein